MTTRAGRVSLVGAGPGDPELITVKGARLLAGADVVVYDRLAAPALLDLAPASAERIYVGKEPGRAAMSQAAIGELLVTEALTGREVVRLKGGDPFVFGRGGEELLACVEAGIEVEVVPGITSAVAAPGCGGHPGHPPGPGAFVRGGDGLDRPRRGHRGSGPHGHGHRHAHRVDGRGQTRRDLRDADRGRTTSPTSPPPSCSGRRRRRNGRWWARSPTCRRWRPPRRIGPPATLIVGKVAALAGVGEAHR